MFPSERTFQKINISYYRISGPKIPKFNNICPLCVTLSYLVRKAYNISKIFISSFLVNLLVHLAFLFHQKKKLEQDVHHSEEQASQILSSSLSQEQSYPKQQFH